MKLSSDKKVNDFLSDLQSVSAEQYDCVNTIRALFFEANSKLSEEIKYGGLAFSLAGQLIGGIFPYRAHISIEFSNGAEFEDENNHLEGGGKKRRHLKIIKPNDIDQKNAMVFIEQAVS